LLEVLETTLAFDLVQKQKTILRSDAGFGADRNVNAALQAGWRILAKGKGGRRPNAYARQIDPKAWIDLGAERWLAPLHTGPTYLKPTQQVLLRWQTPAGLIKHSIVVCSIMDWSGPEIIAHYDDRGQCETEIQADKSGLKLERRRKKQLPAQEMLVLLTDVAHNLLAWTSQWMFPSGPFAQFGKTRLIEDILALPGRLFFLQNRLVEVQLNQHHPYAPAVAEGLERLLLHFGYL